jgi:iron complex outermembrane receptor protein
MLDVQLNYHVPKISTTFKIGASNILDNRVYQTYGGPFIGRLAYVSVLVELDKGVF